MVRTRSAVASFTAALAVVLVAACDQPGAVAPDVRPQFMVDPAGVGETTLCKNGSAADFTVSFQADSMAAPVVTAVHLNDGQCQLVASDHRNSGFMDVTITETVAPNMVLDSILNDSITVASKVYVRKIVKGTNTVTGRMKGNDIGFIYTFQNRVLTPALQITKTADAGTVNAGSNIGFTVTVSNTGTGVAQGVTLSDPLPAGSGISWSESPDNPDCTISSGSLSCSFGDLAAGASRTVHVTSPTTAASCGVYNNTATYNSTNAGTGSASASVTVNCPSLQITKTADNASVAAGFPIGFTVTVTNNGPGSATGVTLSDNLPTGTDVSWSESPDNPSCTIAANVLSCNFGTLASGASATVHVSSPTTTNSCGVYNNTATYSSTNGGTGSASASTTVVCPPPPSGEGCTPGYWKQDQHFDSWVGYTPGQTIGSVFNTGSYRTEKTNLLISSQTLVQGLSFKGGSTLNGAAEILLRAGIAAILNTGAVSYPMTATEVVNAVDAALASNDRDAILALAADLDSKNNGGCPLN